jgi:hypothetical protein
MENNMKKIDVKYIETENVNYYVPTIKRRSILIPSTQYEMLSELAKKDNRPMANYLRVLIEKEYKNITK